MSYTQLTRDDRIRMGVLRQQGKTPTELVELINKHRSSVYRELVRNSCESGYFPETAQLLATQRRTEATSMLRIDDEIKEWVKEKILLKWSPEQISERMKIEYQKRHSATSEFISWFTKTKRMGERFSFTYAGVGRLGRNEVEEGIREEKFLIA